jgi:hypothetical protein
VVCWVGNWDVFNFHFGCLGWLMTPKQSDQRRHPQ